MVFGIAVIEDPEIKADETGGNKNPPDNFHEKIIEEFNECYTCDKKGQRCPNMGQEGAFIGKPGPGGIELFVAGDFAEMGYRLNFMKYICCSGYWI